MKPSHIAAAALAVAFAGAHAQSTVTVYGRLDPTIGKQIGSNALAMQNGTGSRLGFRGVEDLGGGLSAFFTIEHRLNIDSGIQTEAARFWRQSYVGLSHAKYGRLLFGRDYTAAYWDAMVTADPWGNATAANFTTVVTGGISQLREDNQVKYTLTLGPVALTGEVSVDKNQGATSLAPYVHRPRSFSATYGAGPLKAAYGYENPGNNNDYWHALTASYDFGRVNLRGFYGRGKTSANVDRKAYMLAGVFQVTDVGQVFAGYGNLKESSAAGTLQSRLAVGYYHWLSKRTALYVDVANDSKSTNYKTGWDVGMRHFF